MTNGERRDRSFRVSLVLVAVAVMVVYGVDQLSAGRRTRENIRLCASKYQAARTAADTAAVDDYQVAPAEPLRHGAIPAIICRKYRGTK